MLFDPTVYGEQVSAILSIDGHGKRLMPLVAGSCSSLEAEQRLSAAPARQLFGSSFAPEAALAGLWVYFSCFEKGHQTAQEISTAEGSYWHAILHRQEPDASNAGYWFRRVGKHPIFPQLADEARGLGYAVKGGWDPFAFVDFCEEALERPGSDRENLALRVQLAEWQLLFDFCARPIQ